jgi:hypothetical protein
MQSQVKGKALLTFNRIAQRFEIIVMGEVKAWAHNYSVALIKLREYQ